MEKKTILEVPDTLMIAFNMETVESTNKQKDVSFGGKDVQGDSNEAVAGEQDVW